MLLTEQEAKNKWCPQARASDNGDPALSINRTRGNEPDRDCFCLASWCMAWRRRDVAPAKETPRVWWPATEDDDVLKSANGPPRTDVNDHPRNGPLPDTAEWVPMIVQGDDFTGGHWREAAAEFEARAAAATASRRGYCALAGQPEVM